MGRAGGPRPGPVVGAIAIAALAAAFVAAVVHAQGPSMRFARARPALRETGRAHTGSLPKSVTVSPDGREVWVAAFGQRDTDNVDVFDAATLQRIAGLSIRGNPVEILFDRSGRRAFVSSFSAARVMEIELPSRRVRRELPAGLDPKMLALSPDERTLYVVNWRSDDVSVVDLASGSTRTRLATGHHPRGIAVLPDGRLLVASTEADVVHEFAADGRPLRRLPTCEFPRHLVLSPDASVVHVTCSGASAVFTYGVADWQRRTVAPTGRNPRSMAMSRDGRFLAVANYDGRSVSLVDRTQRTSGSLEPREAGRIVGVAINPVGAEVRAYATSWDTRELIAFGPR